MDVAFDVILRLAPTVVYVVIWITFYRRDKHQRAEVKALRERVQEQSDTIADIATERDMAMEYANSLETLVMENEKIVSAADIEIAAAQTKQWIRE